jgi:hypothetical protein
MTGKRQTLSLDIPAVAPVPLHNRTVIGWSHAVNVGELREALKERLLMPYFHDEPLIFGSPKPDFGCWILATWHDLVGAPLNMSWQPMQIEGTQYPYDAANVCIGSKLLRDLMIFGVGEIDWEHRETLAFMCLATYRAFVRRSFGHILGLEHNITIAGAVATCLHLNVGVETR